jgi:hypothetical protein
MKPTPAAKAERKTSNEISEVTLASNIQMMKGISRNSSTPLTRCRIDTSEVSFDVFRSAFAAGVGFIPGWFLKLVALGLIWAYLHHLIAGHEGLDDVSQHALDHIRHVAGDDRRPARPLVAVRLAIESINGVRAVGRKLPLRHAHGRLFSGRDRG